MILLIENAFLSWLFDNMPVTALLLFLAWLVWRIATGYSIYQHRFSRIETDLDKLEATQQEMKLEQHVMKVEQQVMKRDIAELKIAVSGIDARLGRVEGRLDGLEGQLRIVIDLLREKKSLS